MNIRYLSQDPRFERIAYIEKIDHEHATELEVIDGGINFESASVEIKSQLGRSIKTTIVFYALYRPIDAMEIF